MDILKEIENIELSQDLQTLISSEQAWHYGIVPQSLNTHGISFFIDEEKNLPYINEELQLLLNNDITLISAPGVVIQKTLARYYRKSGNASQQIAPSTGHADDFVNKLVREAKELGSSDIHIEIYDEKARIRIRIDGHLVERYRLDKNEYPALINKLKIKANLDIAEKRLPQDGRIFFSDHGQKFDIRVSVLPTLHGEKVVMRLLSNDATKINIEKLGFSETELRNYLEGIRKPNGIMLISGPTGSGKTTTLYATLKILNDEKRNILTVEDPIEYTLDGINQVQLRESIGLTFASALRTFLRQDPDVIMLGEIRDTETAQMAIRAALTGHLVLSTIHTNSAWGTVSRLLDMGIPSFLLSGTLNTSVAQRLVRKLCPSCKAETSSIGKLPLSYKPIRPIEMVFEPVGCQECHFTGYKGRKALYEVIPIDHELADCIRNGVNKVDDILRSKNIKPLADHAFELLESGVTSVDEIYPLLMNH